MQTENIELMPGFVEELTSIEEKYLKDRREGNRTEEYLNLLEAGNAS